MYKVMLIKKNSSMLCRLSDNVIARSEATKQSQKCHCYKRDCHAPFGRSQWQKRNYRTACFL